MTRGPRQMPSLPKLARTLRLGDVPKCYRCEGEVARASWSTATGVLDRAHVIDRWCGGSDEAANLRPLCHDCHEMQPIFYPGDQAVALYWFTGHPVGGGSLIRHHVNAYGEQMVFVHNGRMGLLFHDDYLMPSGPLVVNSAEYVHQFEHGSVVRGCLLSGPETNWLLECVAEGERLTEERSRASDDHADQAMPS